MSTHCKLSIMQSLFHILNMLIQYELRILMLKIECLSFKKKTLKISVFSQEIVIQALCLKDRIYVNLKTKFNLKMNSWSANTLTMYYHQFSTTGSYFVLINIIITELPPLRLICSSLNSELIYMEKKFYNYKRS